MENAKIIEQLRDVLSNLRRTAVKIHNPALRAAWYDSEVRDGEALLDALAESIELSPSATQAPPVHVDGLAEIAKRLRDLELRVVDVENRFARLRDAVEAGK